MIPLQNRGGRVDHRHHRRYVEVGVLQIIMRAVLAGIAVAVERAVGVAVVVADGQGVDVVRMPNVLGQRIILLVIDMFLDDLVPVVIPFNPF